MELDEPEVEGTETVSVFMHCSRCVQEVLDLQKSGMRISPREYAKYECEIVRAAKHDETVVDGYYAILVINCVRHEHRVSVIPIDEQWARETLGECQCAQCQKELG